MCVDEAPVRQRRLQLAPQLADVDVDRAIAGAQLAAPDGSVELLPAYDRAEAPRHRRQQLELPDRQRERSAGREDQALVGADLELAGVEDVSGDIGALRECRHDATASQPALGRRVANS